MPKLALHTAQVVSSQTALSSAQTLIPRRRRRHPPPNLHLLNNNLYGPGQSSTKGRYLSTVLTSARWLIWTASMASSPLITIQHVNPNSRPLSLITLTPTSVRHTKRQTAMSVAIHRYHGLRILQRHPISLLVSLHLPPSTIFLLCLRPLPSWSTRIANPLQSLSTTSISIKAVLWWLLGGLKMRFAQKRHRGGQCQPSPTQLHLRPLSVVRYLAGQMAAVPGGRRSTVSLHLNTRPNTSEMKNLTWLTHPPLPALTAHGVSTPPWAMRPRITTARVRCPRRGHPLLPLHGALHSRKIIIPGVLWRFRDYPTPAWTCTSYRALFRLPHRRPLIQIHAARRIFWKPVPRVNCWYLMSNSRLTGGPAWTSRLLGCLSRARGGAWRAL